ncbi:MAG: helix-turn-helix transcriptional regulator [Methanomethylovorans sp.]|nr:helix-turn-helix transcriptional regulator [Methanomethylovorans sp.]
METIRRIGNAIRKRRSELNLSQEKLAERSNLHRTYISDIERGNRNLTLLSLSKILSALEISYRTFFTEYFDDKGESM